MSAEKIVGALYIKDGLVLVAIRAIEDDILGGMAVLPSGHKHPNETEKDAVIRELLEETGVVAVDIDPEPILRTVAKLRAKEVPSELYLVTKIANKPTLENVNRKEIADARFIPVEELERSMLDHGYPEDLVKELVVEIRKHLAK